MCGPRTRFSPTFSKTWGRLQDEILMDEARIGLALSGKGGGSVERYAPVSLRELIREAARQFGLGSRNSRVPFADIIQPGMRVLVKPNWVLHYNQSGSSMDCMVTHPQFVLAAL